MYGTVARVRLKPGMEERLREQFRAFERAKVPGEIAEYLYRMDKDTREYFLVVLFKDKASYTANADSPEQDARYRKMAELFEGEPEWHDGEVVYSHHTAA